ncbi:MAG: hypothetical protein ACRC1Z_08130 [Waterburya sp.]
MTIKELIYAEIDGVGEENLVELYEVVKDFVEAKANQHKSGVLSKLKRVKIQASEDFAANLDLYLSGEKQFVNNSEQ